MVIDEMEIAVGQDQSDVDLGPSGEKVDDDREDVQPAEGDRRRDDEAALRPRVGARRCALGFADFLKNALAGAT